LRLYVILPVISKSYELIAMQKNLNHIKIFELAEGMMSSVYPTKPSMTAQLKVWQYF
jgi:hypothetical protein